MIERIENIECRLVIENVDRWDLKYKLAIERWKELETSGDHTDRHSQSPISTTVIVFSITNRKTHTTLFE